MKHANRLHLKPKSQLGVEAAKLGELWSPKSKRLLYSHHKPSWHFMPMFKLGWSLMAIQKVSVTASRRLQAEIS